MTARIFQIWGEEELFYQSKENKGCWSAAAVQLLHSWSAALVSHSHFFHEDSIIEIFLWLFFLFADQKERLSISGEINVH